MDVGLSRPDLADISTVANWGPRATTVAAAMMAARPRSARLGGGAGGFIISQPHIKTLSLARQ